MLVLFSLTGLFHCKYLELMQLLLLTFRKVNFILFVLPTSMGLFFLQELIRIYPNFGIMLIKVYIHTEIEYKK